MSYLERYIRTAQGTSVGIIASFTSFFETAMRASGLVEAPHHLSASAERTRLERLMDALLGNQERAMRMVCGRFAAELALVVIRDHIAHHEGLYIPTDLFMQVFRQRMKRLMAPAKEHGLPLLLHSGGKLDQILPIIHDLGFQGVHPVAPEYNDIYAIRKQWAGKLALVGNVPTTLLIRGSRKRIRKKVRECCTLLAPGGGYVLSSSAGITDEVPPENLTIMTRAVHQYGRYGSLGDDGSAQGRKGKRGSRRA
jgi:uroporphyrinogen decarboxylase